MVIQHSAARKIYCKPEGRKYFKTYTHKVNRKHHPKVLEYYGVIEKWLDRKKILDSG